MPNFKFKAKNIDGKEMEGVREASDSLALARDLRKESYILIDFKEESPKKKFSLAFLTRFFSVPLSERMIFTRNLSVMIGAGLSISRSLTILEKQAKNKQFKKIISQIYANLEKGNPLSQSLAEYPNVFSPLYVAMVKAGEKSGKIEESLKLIANQLNKDYILIRRVRGAMIYPAVIMVAMLGIGILMLYYVVPTLISVFEEMNVELPFSTKIVIWLSKSLVSNSLVVLGILMAFIVGIIWLLRLKSVKVLLDRFYLHVPILSSLMKQINSARTARILSSLITSGVGILEALDVTAEVIQNSRYKIVLYQAKESIQKGELLSAAFKKSEDVYPPFVGELIAVGEESGELPQMLTHLAVFYEGEVADATKDLSTIIEPLLMLFMGVAVGFFAVAMLKPMYSLVSSF